MTPKITARARKGFASTKALASSHSPPSLGADEHVTVLQGTFLVGMGDAVDTTKAQRLGAGGFITAPANAHHYAVAKGVTILQESGEGPFLITYVKDSDDPRHARATP